MSVSRRELINVSILVLSQVVFMVASITVMTLSGVVGRQLSPDPGLATLPVSLMMVGTVVSTLPASLFMKRVGRRLGFILGTLLGGAGGSLISFAGIALNSFPLFCLGNLCLGFYQGFAMYYRFAAADVAGPGFRSRAISLVMAGGVLSAFIGPWNASATLDWISSVPSGGPFLMLSALALCSVLLLTQLRVPVSGEPHAGASRRPMRVVARQPAFRVALLSGAVGYAIMVLVMTATPLAMKSEGFAMADVAFIMQWHVLGMFAPSFVTGSLISRFGVARILLSGALLLVAAAILASLGQTLWLFWWALVLLGVGWNFLFIGGSALLASCHSESERGLAQGVNDLTIFSLVAVGSLLSGQLFYQLGWKLLNLSMLPFIGLVILAVLAWLLHLQRASRQASEQQDPEQQQLEQP